MPKENENVFLLKQMDARVRLQFSLDIEQFFCYALCNLSYEGIWLYKILLRGFICSIWNSMVEISIQLVLALALIFLGRIP